MKVFFDPIQKAHAPETFLVSGMWRPCPEVPERADRFLAAVRDLGLSVTAPGDAGMAPLAAIHTAEYLDFLRTIHARWQDLGGSRDVLPNVHPVGREGCYPRSPVGRAGYHLGDTACPVTAETWEAVYRSAQTAVAAADAVRGGDRVAYALCRPPGHHAAADLAGGFCYLNNAAIAAQRLRSVYDRVATLDIDLHHGNGTQNIFYQRGDVLTVSLHADPMDFYPFFWGHAAERGAGPGLGANLNLPLALGTEEAGWLAALDVALARIAAFAPGALVVSLGVDASAADPFGGLRVSPEGFVAAGQRIAALGLPTALVQEGGYLSDSLGLCLNRFLSGVLETVGA
ncbi:histone deacetylase family protein [Roseospira marina]|uniref:Histone deacetylase family protein n=1 Tax=Roseospira marina TaxID=140057 RepID=A0A5M6ICB3_9PROT|nr:histone deacetylase family protein [Roseospira marina]KAA5605375.1 histone deacetylase family protein [Roseospira marina]MBB4314639.1 acetoin utilization deacetylase AcuC-like enzyme [Roseospira marina]MBB5088756.1 acetoin utilization deacetylase AcuC-like enzyme [Roseospira marina]